MSAIFLHKNVRKNLIGNQFFQEEKMNKKLRLTELSKVEMHNLNAGAEEECICLCGCRGPSSNYDNGVANRDSGKETPGGGTIYPPEG